MADTQYWPLQPKQQSASDIRKVIANATKTTWKWFTIANNDELKEQKEKKEQKQVKVSTPSWTVTRTNTNVETPKVETSTVKEAPQWPTPFPVIDKSQLTWDIFKNPQLQWIKNIPTFQEDNQAEHNVASRNNNDESFMNTFWRATELKKPVDVDNALMDLFVDVRWKVKSWTLAQSDVVKMKELYPEFANMWDDVILSMIWDMASIANKNMPFNNENMAKFKSLYPELTAASWGFDKWSSENMYQAWWMREQMAQSSKTDLNRFWTAWAVAEWIMNPLWEVTTLADMWAQMIPQVDGSWNENRLKKALSKLTDEDINKYYEQYQNYVKNHWTLSNLYTLQLEWDTVVEQLWNWATGKWKKDVDAWFRDWLIDRVNNEVNWWAWEVTWAANDLKWVWWPNIAKMYANMPASTVKTITAITRAITNPVDTAAWLYHLFWTEEGRQALIARYGSWDWFAKALEQDPVWVASDWLAIVEWWAWLTKMAAWWLSKASLLAWLSTEALWAARTTENLLKLATRLENMAIKAGKVEKTAWLASNIWVDLPINKVINWLKTWWESWESLIQKAAKYTANKATTWVWTIAGKVVDTGKDIIKKWPINSLADLLMGSATDSDKLFKAASPNINRLSNNVDYKNKRAKMDLAEQAIVDAWYLPKSISEWAKAHTETLNKKWNEFKQMVADKWDVMVDVRDILKDVKDYIKSEKEWATELQKQDLRKLEVEVNALERMWKVDMNFIEKRKEHYNSSWRDSDKLKVWDVYLKGIKMIGNAMRKQQDNILGKWPESTKKLRSEIAALMDTKNDVIKADIRNQKKKSDISWGGLVESYWRLSWLWDVIWWVVWWLLGKWWEWFAQAWKWIGKMVLWKAMGRAKDVDYLTKKGFEGLSNKKKAQNSAWLQSKFKDSKELWNLYVERDNLRKELKKDNISDSRKEEINKRLDDIEYAIAQKKARAWLWDKERVLSEENKKKVIDMVSKRAKDVWFTTEVLDWMEKDTQGYTDLRKKLIALEKNPWDTTAQHELFHAFFSVVDNKTKTYILDEAKKILKDSWMKDVNAEEWLAESFGIYAKRKQIKLWLIDAPKGFVAKVSNFFQKVYEFMQRFNGDRATINKVFDEVLWDRQMKNWIIDLSDLLGDKEVKVRELWDNWLRNKSVYHGSPADFDKFDSSHMWEGEWAQAHGWGHYVAVNKDVATWYARELNQATYQWKTEKQMMDKISNDDFSNKEDVMARFILEEVNKNMNSLTIADALENIKNYYKREVKKWRSEYKRTKADEDLKYLKKYEENLKSIESLKESDFSKQNRNVYDIDIPDPKKADTPTWKNYIEEDEKIWKSALNKMVDWFRKDWWEVEDSYGNVNVSKWWVEFWLWDWTDTWKYIIQNEISNPKAFSQALNKMWYDWIHYDWHIDEEAYVIFNDDALQIKDHIRYKKKIWDKDVEINKDITSPEQMAKVNSKGLSVIHDFISEKQAEKALNVNKALLDKDGNAYLWTHTNKYSDNPITNFENVKDSRYKWYTDQWKEIVWLTNNENMSKSYAWQKSKLADTKAPKTEEEFNKWLKDKTKELQKEYWWQVFWKDEKLIFTVKEGKDWYYLEREIKNNNEVMDKDKFRSWVAMWQWLTMSDLEKKEKNLWWLEWLMKSQEDRLKNNWYANVDFKIDWDNVILNYSEIYKATPEFKDKKEFYAKAFSSFQGKNYYHYQGIIQDMKKPLVVDFWEERYWNDLWKVSDMLTENQHKSLVASSHWRQFYTQKVLDFIHEITAVADEYEAKQWWKYYSPTLKDNFFRILRDDISFLNTDWIKELINNYDTIIDDALEFDRSKWNFDWLQTFRDVAEHSIELIEENRPQLEKALFKNVAEELKAVWWEWLVNHYKEQFWLNANELLLNQEHFRDALHDKLETNDWVKYALSKWEYDWVIFKNVRDYWWTADKSTPWDVVAAFNSKQFKAWDNSNPTDSKYISYKKKVSLDKKPEWLSKKDSNWLLAKGRERTLGNNGMRYKTNISEKDSSGKKLSEWQKKFFAGSKVVDKDGNLLRVYHGTRWWDFTVFQKWHSWSNNLAWLWYWFTPNKEWALKFAEWSRWWDSKPRAEEVYLDIKNPKIYEPNKFNLLSNKEKEAKIDKQREIYRDKASKADWLDYTKAYWFFHDEYDHPFHERQIFEYLKRSWNNDRKYDWKYWKYNPEEYRALAEEWNKNQNANLDYDKILKDFEEYTKAKLVEEKEYDKLLEIKHNDPYDDFMYDIYKIDRTPDMYWNKDDLNRALNDYNSPNKFVEKLKKEWYDGIIIKGTEYDWEVIWWWARNDQYVAFDSNQIKRITNENPTKNEDIRFKRKNTDDIVWHASPYAFDKYDANKRITGYWWQVYWAGIYTSEDLWMVAGKYWKKDADRFNSETMYKWLPLREQYDEKYVAQIMHDSMMNWLTFKEAKQEIVDAWKDTKDPNKKAMLKELWLMKKLDFDGKGNLYTYKIDKDGKWLDWQQKTSPEDVNLISKELAKINKEWAKKFDDYMKSSEYATLGQNIYQELSRTLWGDQKASDFLKSIWFEGNKYKAESNKYNYVIFDYDKPINEHIRFKKQTDTPEFKKWFEGSKVVDKSWKPLEVVHETDWDALKEPKGKAVFDKNKSASWWFWFSDIGSTPWYEYGDNKLKVYLKMQNPNIVKSEHFPWRSVIIAAAEEKWYDWAIRKWKRTDWKDYTVYYVNEPNQIKSATDNIWTFDKNNPDIRYKRAYHGSKSDFDKFDSSHNWEGEWTNMQWWWTYVSENKDTAKMYAEITGTKWNRHIYEVEIPDEKKADTPSWVNYLYQDELYDWDVMDKFVELTKKELWDKADLPTNKKILDFWSDNKDLWSSIYYSLEHMLWWQKEASKFLEKLWYDGMVYYWGKNFLGWNGDEWFNTIIFNDKSLEIKSNIRYKKWLQKKESWLEKKDIRYKLNQKGFTPWINLTETDFDEMKTRDMSFIKTKDWTNWKDTLRRVKNRIKSDLWIDVIDWMRMPTSWIRHVYNWHWYDTELWYWKSITKQDFTKIPDILENYSTITNTLDANWNKTNTYTLTKDYWKDRYNLVIEIVNLKNWWNQIWLKTFYVNDATWRAKFAQDKATKDIRQIRSNAKKQYWDRFHL